MLRHVNTCYNDMLRTISNKTIIWEMVKRYVTYVKNNNIGDFGILYFDFIDK